MSLQLPIEDCWLSLASQADSRRYDYERSMNGYKGALRGIAAYRAIQWAQVRDECLKLAGIDPAEWMPVREDGEDATD